jgi:excisionase family DNA binding protein
MEINILTAKELADLLKLKESTVCRLAAEGQLPGFKIGKAWRFDMEDVNRHIAKVKSLFGKEKSADWDQAIAEKNNK